MLPYVKLKPPADPSTFLFLFLGGGKLVGSDMETFVRPFWKMFLTIKYPQTYRNYAILCYKSVVVKLSLSWYESNQYVFRLLWVMP